MPGRFLNLFKPLSRVTLEVKAPEKTVSFNEKLFWTFIVLAVYLIMSEVPLFGIKTSGLGDPLQAMRVIFASRHGTLMELGIGPIVTSGLILQLLVGAKFIECDLSNADDKALFTTANKFFAVLMTAFQAALYWFGGAWGSLSIEANVLIFLQLIAAGIILMLMDELVQKGWGIGSGISLFIAAGVAQTILWYSLSPLIGLTQDNKFLGAIPAFFQGLLNGEDLWTAIRRSGYPDMFGFISTIVIFIIVIYLEGIRVELPIMYARFRGYRGRFPVKLLYVSNIPVIFASALLANIYFGTQILWSRFNPNNDNLWLNLLGRFETVEGQLQPMSGSLAYYITSPRDIGHVLQDPLRGFTFVGITVALCAGFSATWMEVGGMGPRDVAKQLIDSGAQIPGYRRTYKSIEEILKKYIPTVTLLGGIIVGLVASTADFFNVFGSGMGVLLTVGILYQLYQTIMRERVSEMYPAIRRILGE